MTRFNELETRARTWATAHIAAAAIIAFAAGFVVAAVLT
jgi:hypothetical protein